VVVIRAKGRELTGGGGKVTGAVRFGETGSGVLISADGKIVTAAHVVHSMDEITVEVVGGEKVPPRVIASEPAANLSLLQIDRIPKGLVVAPMGNSDLAKVGNQVIVVGAPYGLDYSLSVGWISHRWSPGTVYKNMPLAEFFQTDAAINTGNSGGPMFNLAGEVIGIVSHVISKSGGSEGLGFAVTINTVKDILLAKRPFWAGLEGTVLAPDLAELLNIAGRRGYLLKTVAKGSPAEALGLRGDTTVVTIEGEQHVLGGDLVLDIDGIPMDSVENITRILRHLGALSTGLQYVVRVLRGGQEITLTGRIP
jgi:serine protease Do